MACRPVWGGTFCLGCTFLFWEIHLSLIAMFTFGNIAVRTARRPGYSKYWNLFVEKANVTTKPSPGSDAAVTSMPILEHKRATR